MMAPVDSDDSSDADLEFTETDVLLGYASKTAGGQTISHLGGRPEWLDPSKPPSASQARCKICSDIMVLIMQLNCELPDRFPGHERRLYVFSCRRKPCRRKEGSIRTLRETRLSPETSTHSKSREEKEKREREEKEKRAREEEERQERDRTEHERKERGSLGETLFGVQGKGLAGTIFGSANPFSTCSGGADGSPNPFAKHGAATATANSFTSSVWSTPSTPAEHTEETRTKPEPTSTKYSTSDLPKTFAETLSLNNPKAFKYGPIRPLQTTTEPWPPEFEQPKPYPVSYLSEAEYETLDPITPPRNILETDVDIDDFCDDGRAGVKEDKDAFESTIDSTFQEFADRLAQNPEQCIRYEFGGQPLLYSKADAVGKKLHKASTASKAMPRCGNCSGERVFEVQLVPEAISELEIEEEGMGGMDWGTIIVGVCARDCVPHDTTEGEVAYLEEWVGVQWEELM